MIEYLYQALASDHGIKVETNDVEGLRQRLYAARRKAMDPSLDVLSLVPSPTGESILWIVKRNGDSQSK